MLEKLQHLQQAEATEDIISGIFAEPKMYRKRIQIPSYTPFWMLKEEALWWMRWSLEAPLSPEGHNRYMTVFRLLYPEHAAITL